MARVKGLLGWDAGGSQKKTRRCTHEKHGSHISKAFFSRGRLGFVVLGDWLGADSGAAGDDDAQERYLVGLRGGGIALAIGGVDGDILCGGGDFLDCAYSVG